jgi:hypothetical protein
MPLFTSKLELTSTASGSGKAIADVEFVRGAFRTVATAGALDNIGVEQVADGQIVWVEAESSTYQATLVLADYVNTFSDTVTWSTFSGFGSGGGGGASNIGELTDVTTGSLSNGQVLQYNSSTGKWEASTVSGTGDISAVFAGDGLSGGGSAGSVSLDVDAGLGIELTTDGVNLDTGSAHFINAINNLSTSGIFTQTGSYYSTTNDLQVSGSMRFQYDGSTTPFAIDSGSEETFSVSGEGILRIISQSSTPDVVEGGIYRGNDNNFYLGI